MSDLRPLVDRLLAEAAPETERARRWRHVRVWLTRAEGDRDLNGPAELATSLKALERAVGELRAFEAKRGAA